MDAETAVGRLLQVKQASADYCNRVVTTWITTLYLVKPLIEQET
jgi:hypothetical protein